MAQDFGGASATPPAALSGSNPKAPGFAGGYLLWCEPGLPEIVAVARRHKLPVIVDAAGQLLPAENLMRFVAEGADLVAFSGGKAIGGPQASGFLAGRRPLIQSAALQQLDHDTYFEQWSAPVVTRKYKGAPAVELALDADALGFSALELVKRLQDGEPSVHANHARVRDGIVVFGPTCMKAGDAAIVIERVLAELRAGSARG